ncbi:antibiotic biosynthesis monooxygenase [Streptomyces sp. CAU 1734]|uniref:antibiotic biosynthesis monooxygenase n=1 Tax=Streptomyces sp. CAU 1734 TaxID=3140360 RepID=UPI003260AAA7
MPVQCAEPAAPADPETGFVTFGVLRTEGPEAAAEVITVLTAEVREWVRYTPGFISSRVHISADGATVINRGEWTSEAAYRTSFRENPAGAVLHGLGSRPGVIGASVFSGVPAEGFTGPEASAEPGVVMVATRHLDGHESARALLELLSRSGQWKREFPGFISVTPYLGRDGTTFVSYPMWVNEAAYRSWTEDPRISEGQQEVARLEVAPPEYVLCTVAAQVDAAPRDPGAAVGAGGVG